MKLYESSTALTQSESLLILLSMLLSYTVCIRTLHNIIYIYTIDIDIMHTSYLLVIIRTT